MGFFSRILGSEATPTSLSKTEAFTGILLAAVAADGYISDEEVTDFNSFVTKSKTLSHLGGNEFKRMIDKLFRILKKEGIDKLIELCAASLPKDLGAGTFAMACDLLFSDGVIDVQEERMLDKLKRQLQIADEAAQRIAEVIVLKNNV